MIVALAVVVIVVLVAAQAAALLRRPPKALVGTAPASAPLPFDDDRPRDPFNKLVGVLRRRRWVRRSLSVVSVAAMLVAIGVIGYPFYTNMVQDRIQDRLDRQFESDELRQAYVDRTVEEGDSLTRIRIPRLDVEVVVVEGTTSESLKAGAGHYANTPLPCEAGNVAIAGHRTTYGRPFADLDLLRPGDEIILEVPGGGSCTYEMQERPFITTPDNFAVVENTDDSRVTLTTCHPKGSARQRLIVQAVMVSSEPANA